MASASEFVVLQGGLAVPIAPMLLLLDLESRGITAELDGKDVVLRPRQLLTTADTQAVKRWKRHILALLAYDPPAVM